jgi:tetratricopeptide (TPR) repeat protein
LALHRALGNRSSEALMLNNLGDVFQTEHRMEEALQCFTEALALHRETGGRSGEVLVLGNFAAVYRDLGRHGEALRSAEEALNLVRRTGDLHAEAYTLNRVASVHLELGRHQVAMELHAEALEITRQTRGRDPEIDAHIGMAAALAGLSRFDEGREHGERAVGLIDTYGLRRYEGYAYAVLARVHVGLGDRARALVLARSALECHRRVGQPLGVVRAQELVNQLSDC